MAKHKKIEKKGVYERKEM